MVTNRKRDSVATKAAIAEAARNQFAQYGYDATGLRQIADQAGVNVALINRYFGSKENLFKQVIIPTLRFDILMESGIDEFIDRVIEIKRNAHLVKNYDPTLVIIRTLESAIAGPMVRQALHDHVIIPLSKMLTGQLCEKRAEMIGALLLGYDMHHRGTKTPGGSQEAQKLLRQTLEFLVNP